MTAAQGDALLRDMCGADLDAVMAIESRAYDFPWTRGNFSDSIGTRYVVQVLAQPQGAVLGYFVAMPGFEEMHLLNITVDPLLQGRGLGLHLLDAVLLAAVLHGADLLWLEVRPSNRRALRLYERYGFHAVAKRRAYYPALDAEGRPCKEDAIVMSARVEQLRQRRGMH
jgi:ribosomal-protein-alanine N-acetyltransferase